MQYFRYPIVACALALMVVGCASQTNSACEHVPPSRTESPLRGVLIVSAVYGSGVNFADVTYRVNELLRQPDVEFFARPEWLHADPTPNWNKALVIVYEVNGQRRIFTTGEGGSVSVDRLLDRPRKRALKKLQ
jgi:hypothetical protein